MIGSKSRMTKKQQLYWMFQFGGWAFYTLINYLALPLFNTDLPHSEAFMVASFLAGVAVTHAYRHYLESRRWHELSMVKLMRNVFVGSLALMMFYFAVLTALDMLLYLAAWLFTGENLPQDTKWDDGYWAFFYLSVINVYAVFLIWSVLYFVFKYFENYREARYQQLEAQNKLKDAVMLNLRNQLNPHFLFNALNSIRSLTLSDAAKARTAVTLLSDLLRYTLSSEQKNFVTLKEELDVVRDYLELEKIRFEERLDFSVDAEADVLQTQVPPLAVMALVENAIKHGIGKLKQGGTVNVVAKLRNGLVDVEVVNSGLFSPNGGGGIGLANTRQRLNILYNQKATFTIEQQQNNVSARIQIPLAP
jgi:hypothetical protein